VRFEIGSHFEFDNSVDVLRGSCIQWLPSQYNLQYTFSGRAAIELAIIDIKEEHNINSVYMPSYCCNTMVQPFLDNDIKVNFYEVSFDKENGIKYNIDTNINCDIFFAISYFGIEQYGHDSLLKELKKKKVIILEDITHSLLNDQPNTEYSDYCIASLRKWFPVATGGFVAKQKSEFIVKPSINSNSLTHSKILAMKEKMNYLRGENIDKESFLTSMTEFEQKLGNKDYRYEIDSFSKKILEYIDIELIKTKRRRNFQVLYEGIKDLEFINMLIPNFNLHNNTPLFLPLIMEGTKKRDELRTFLIKHKIYCPIHWPKAECNSSSISLSEISLVCDQRYSETDMNYFVDLIKDWHDSVYKEY